MTATICHNRDYLKAALGIDRGARTVLEGFLREGAPLLWQDRPDKAESHKDRFTARYVTYACGILMVVIEEWLTIYDGESAYQDFYAQKLWKTAKRCMYGENERGQLWQVIQSKPDVQVRFFYDSDAWEELGK